MPVSRPVLPRGLVINARRGYPKISQNQLGKKLNEVAEFGNPEPDVRLSIADSVLSSPPFPREEIIPAQIKSLILSD